MLPLKDDNPKGATPYMTISIFALNLLIFFYQLSLGRSEGEFILRMAAIPYEITRLTDIPPQAALPVPLTLFSSMFLHGGFAHIAGNMLYLWIFGNNVEDELGHLRFLVFYLATGLAAALTHIVTDVSSPVPMIGASGAIAGVLGGYMMLFPRARVLTLFIFFFIPRLIWVPAVFFLGIWFLFQILGSSSGGGVAWFAHIGGFIAGLILVNFLRGRRYRYRDG